MSAICQLVNVSFAQTPDVLVNVKGAMDSENVRAVSIGLVGYINQETPIGVGLVPSQINLKVGSIEIPCEQIACISGFINETFASAFEGGELYSQGWICVRKAELGEVILAFTPLVSPESAQYTQLVIDTPDLYIQTYWEPLRAMTGPPGKGVPLAAAGDQVDKRT